MHPFSTASGTGVMIEGVYGPGRTVAVWSGTDRVYALYPDTREVSRSHALIDHRERDGVAGLADARAKLRSVLEVL